MKFQGYGFLGKRGLDLSDSLTENPTATNYDLSIVIPAYNEAGGIVATLDSLRSALPDCEIIVVDDGSRDETATLVARYPDVRLIRHRYNKGYGGALKTGMRNATRDIVAWFDADNEHRVGHLKEMVSAAVPQTRSGESASS